MDWKARVIRAALLIGPRRSRRGRYARHLIMSLQPVHALSSVIGHLAEVHGLQPPLFNNGHWSMFDCSVDLNRLPMTRPNALGMTMETKMPIAAPPRSDF